MTKRRSWRFSTGEWRLNRVRVFTHPVTGLLFLEFRDVDPLTGARKRRRVALGHRDTEKAKVAAETVSARLRAATPAHEPDLTVGELIDSYEREVTPTKAPTTRKHDKRAFALFRRYFGPSRSVRLLDRRDWDGFIRERRSGRLHPPGLRSKKDRIKEPRPVKDRIIEQDLRLFLAACNWATRLRRASGEFVLDRSPFAGFDLPREQSPHRPILTSDELAAMYAVADQVSPLFGLLLATAHQTGHRIGAVCQLRWSDVDLEAGRIRWRAENDKIGYEHVTPLVPELAARLRAQQRHTGAIGEQWVFPAPAGKGPVSRLLARDWWLRAVELAKIPAIRGRGWHSLRRLFATELRHNTPLKDLCLLGGWKNPQTVLVCYQQADEGTMRRALEQRASRHVASA